MFGQNRQQLRQYYHNVWQKAQKGQTLSSLESGIAQVIEQHPEYHTIFKSDSSLEQEYFVEDGKTNPYLHMGLHISLHEQISTDRPLGIRGLYTQLQMKFSNAHDAEHKMMECLTESLWTAQRNNQPPSEQNYLASLKKLLTH
ncbi:MAG: hypothetical protein ACI9QV_001443 [Methylophagaceae bacterium]|jgi:hypothetical protein